MKEITFEKALEKLEKIVEELEGGDFSLDASLKKYEEGVKLARFCRDKLGKARQKIEALTRDRDGKFVVKDFKEGTEKE